MSDLGLELTGGLLRDRGQRSGFLLLAAFLVTFLFIRTSARLIRDPRVTWWPGNVETRSGLHIHHLVWGIGLLLSAGFLGLALDPPSPWRELVAVAFGIGAGLTLDEFALVLYVQDVYWAKEGRASLDAVVVAALLAGLVVMGLAPFDLEEQGGSIAAVACTGLVVFLLAAVAIVKGKLLIGLVGVFVPLVALVGAIRLARPGSRWAKRRYAAGGEKLRRAQSRERRRHSRRTAWMNRIGGAPSE
jgi:hypothetical protein